MTQTNLPNEAREAGRTAAMLENITKMVDALATELKPVPSTLLTIQNTLTNLTTTVTGHDVTLHGEKNENGLVGEVSSLKKEFKEFKGAVGWAAGSSQRSWPAYCGPSLLGRSNW